MCNSITKKLLPRSSYCITITTGLRGTSDIVKGVYVHLQKLKRRESLIQAVPIYGRGC